MKKKILSGLFTLALISTVAYGVSKSNKNETALSDLALSNVEALADGEIGGGSECRWATRETWAGWEAICIRTGVGYTCSCGDVKPYKYNLSIFVF